MKGAHIGFSGFQNQKKSSTNNKKSHIEKGLFPQLYIYAIKTKTTSSWLPASPSNKDRVETLSSMAIHLEPVGGMEIVVLLLCPEGCRRKKSSKMPRGRTAKALQFWPKYLNDPILRFTFLHLFVQTFATNSHYLIAWQNTNIDSKDQDTIARGALHFQFFVP